MYHSRKLLIVAVAFLAGVSHAAEDLSQLLEKGLYQEEYLRDFAAAIGTYETMLAEKDGHAALLLQARFHAATCYLKLGNRDEAAALLEDVLQNLPKADALVKETDQTSIDLALRKILDVSLLEIDREALLTAAFEGMATKLGDHADYYDPSELDNFNVSMNNRLTGIGALMSQKDGRYMVNGIVDGGPAQEAGLVRGDEVLSVDDEPARTFPGLIDLVSVLRGKEGTKVRLKVLLAETAEERDFELVRREITLQDRGPVVSVLQDQWFLDDDKEIGAIGLTSFTQDSDELLEIKINELVEQGMKALVLDLRGNGGGSLQSSVAIADFFLSEGLIVAKEGRNSAREEFFARPELTYTFPVAVLVDRDSASASEIVAAALQDHSRAAIIGERTHGKGTVESIVAVAGGGAMKMSIASFVRPSGKALRRLAESDEWGVNPDNGMDARAPRPESQVPAQRQMLVDVALQKALAYCRAQLGN